MDQRALRSSPGQTPNAAGPTQEEHSQPCRGFSPAPTSGEPSCSCLFLTLQLHLSIPRPYPQKGGHKGPAGKPDSPIVTETIVSLALTLLPGAWKTEGEVPFVDPQRASGSRCCWPACQRNIPGLGAHDPRIAWSSWQDVSLGQSCHRSYQFCPGGAQRWCPS